jgi:hypothetical protein
MIPVLAAAVQPAFGHHSLYGLYEPAENTTMHGVVTEFRFVNPHPVLVIEVRSDDGEVESWELEMDNRRELVRIGVTAGTLRAGDRVFVRGSVGLRRPNSFYLRRLDRPADGFWYEQRGSTPYVGTHSVGVAAEP